MFLKKIELNGFKSFSNKKEIFINSGITGIVGPNGSGKSNIADAMRWVLGEQSFKNLRGTTMQDVIFNGTQKLNKKGYCEVSLTFDNTTDKLNLGFSEICIKRKMYRSGESEYYINNSLCRLYDILDLFRDTGIGKEGYSIIGQGRIDDILSSKPLQRRQVFEEAAGISKYKARKEEAERNLQKTADNITRIEDILSEIESQLLPLERQMQDAKHYVWLRERLRIIEANLFLHQYNQTEERIEQIERQYSEKSEELSDIEKNIELYTINDNQLTNDLEKLQKIINKYNVGLNTLACEKERLKGELAVECQKENYCYERHNNIRAEIAAAVKIIKKNILEIKTKKEQHIECNNALSKIDQKISKFTDRTHDFKVLGLLKKKITQKDELYKKIEAKMNTLSVRQTELSLKEQLSVERISELRSKIDTANMNCKKLSECVNELQLNLDENTKYVSNLKEEIRLHCACIKNVQAELDKAKSKLIGLNRKIDERTSRLEILSDIERNREGYFESVKKLLSIAQDNTYISALICGVVAECIETMEGYETTIEIVLGSALQNIIVKRSADAKTIIAYLRKNNIGRITFLPIEALKIKYLNQKEKDLLSFDGIIGTASDLIKCDALIRPAVDFLLARTVVAKDMESALRLAKNAGFSFRIVTIDGDIINSGGVMIGGVINRTKTGILNRKKFTDKIKQEIEELKNEIMALKVEIKAKHTEEVNLKEEQQNLDRQLRTSETDAIEIRQKLITVEYSLENENKGLITLSTGLEKNIAEYNMLNEQLSSVVIKITDKKAQLDELLLSIINDKNEYDRINKDNEDIKDSVVHLEAERLELLHKIDLIIGVKNQLHNFIADKKVLLKANLNKKKELKKEAVEIAANKCRISSRIAECDIKLEKADESIKEKLEYREQLQEQKHIECDLLREAYKQRDGLTEQKYKLSALIDKNRQQIETLQSIIWENHALTYANAKKLSIENFSYKGGVEEADTIKCELADLGAINPNAVEEYNRVKSRYDELDAQRTDLLSAQADLKIIIENLLNRMIVCFKEKMALINKNFGDVFSELFGGGIAEVRLLDDNDAMASGIEIIAEPPGKKLQSVTLLSGGEKALTAIALLFAMLKINPSPICLLDEIDAPLDDANLIRFSEYLCKLTTNALQFIVITHRKPTMAVCHTLYGVAMHEKGVSDIVSVNIG